MLQDMSVLGAKDVLDPAVTICPRIFGMLSGPSSIVLQCSESRIRVSLFDGVEVYVGGVEDSVCRMDALRWT